MADREKVIKGLKCCIDPAKKCYECPYADCVDQITTSEKLLCDALSLLKEQEPISPTVNENHGYAFEIYKCGACGGFINHRARYCEHCGRAVKWDA